MSKWEASYITSSNGAKKVIGVYATEQKAINAAYTYAVRRLNVYSFDKPLIKDALAERGYYGCGYNSNQLFVREIDD